MTCIKPWSTLRMIWLVAWNSPCIHVFSCIHLSTSIKHGKAWFTVSSPLSTIIRAMLQNIKNLFTVYLSIIHQYHEMVFITMVNQQFLHHNSFTINDFFTSLESCGYQPFCITIYLVLRSPLLEPLLRRLQWVLLPCRGMVKVEQMMAANGC